MLRQQLVALAPGYDKRISAAQQRVARRRSQLTTTDWVSDTAVCACRMQRHVAEGQCPPTISSWRLHAQSREPQKASQAHIAVASRTPLSRGRTNPRVFASFPEYARLRDSCGEL